VCLASRPRSGFRPFDTVSVLSAPAAPSSAERGRVWAALFVVWVLWSTSYLALGHLVTLLPPLLAVALRNALAAVALIGVAVLCRQPAPGRRQLLRPALVGLLLVGLGESLLSLGLQTASPGRSAVLYAAVPILTSVLLACSGQRLNRGQTAGAVLGVCGVALLNLDLLRPGQAGGPRGEGLVLASAVCAALAAVLATRAGRSPHRMPESALWAAGVQLLVGASVAGLGGLVRGEVWPGWPPLQAWAALAWLSLVLSAGGYAAYNHLQRVSGPLVAASYAYVNPPVALALAWLLTGEALDARELAAVAIVLAGVLTTVLAGRVNRP
jgi:drug/metabolite transporter (DMT)-like permease